MLRIRIPRLIAAGLTTAALLAPSVSAGRDSTTGSSEGIEDWAALAAADIRGACEIYRENHPGNHDRQNPAFAQTLARACRAGLEAAAHADSRDAYAKILPLFSSYLGDGHSVAYLPPPTTASPMIWPGFVTAWRGDRLLVHFAGDGSPLPEGTRILACDGKDIARFIRDDLRFNYFRPKEAGQWWMRGASVFGRSMRRSATRPRRCSFALPDGRRLEGSLEWSLAPGNLATLMQASTDGERTEIGLTEIRPDLYLIGLPTFSPDEAEIAAYRRLFAEVEERRPELLQARAVILDLRHNNGGSSVWSNDLARLLWGEAAVNAKEANLYGDVEIWWRASEGNRAHIADVAQRMEERGHSDTAEDYARIAAGMENALNSGEVFFVEPEESEAAGPDAQTAKPPFRTPVYVITPGRCASACLDAVDIFSAFGNVKLIGAPTAGDTTYMEVRYVELPSRIGVLVVPTKIWRGRKRGSGEIYRPDILVTDLDWSTETFLDAVAEDLDAADS